MKKARRMYEKILQQMENVCCLPEASVSVEWKSDNTLCCPTLLPRSPRKLKTKFHAESAARTDQEKDRDNNRSSERSALEEKAS